MSALKPPMTPASMGSLPTPTAQVLPSPARQNVGVNVSHTPSATTSPYRSSNPHLSGTPNSRPEQAVVFVFDATYLTREMYFKLTAKGGSLEGIMRRLVDNGKQSLRVGKASDGPTSAGKASAKEVEQGKGKGKANEDEGFELRVSTIVTASPSSSSPSSSTSKILYQQYFQPYRDFIIALPLLLGYFKSARDLSPETSPVGPLAGIKFGYDEDTKGDGNEDNEWLEEFGLAVSAEEEAVKSEPTTTTPSRRDAASSQCLLEGAVAALELFDMQRNHPFVVPDMSPANPKSGATPSPFPSNKQLSATSALTPQPRPSPLLSALHLTPSSARRGRRSQTGTSESDKTDTYLIIFAGKDPLYTEGFDVAPVKTPVPGSARSSKFTTLKDPTSDVLTGLPSPSPSPEDKHSRAKIDPSPKRSSRQTVLENKTRIYDSFGWNQVLEEICRRDIAFGWVHLASDDPTTSVNANGILAKFFDALRKRPQKKRHREYLEEGPWWEAKDGEKAMFKGLNPVRLKKTEVEMKITVDAEKNANGKRPYPVGASPLEQDMANEAKRFKADAAAAAAARVGTPTGLPFPSPVIPNVPGQPGAGNANITPQQMAALQQARAQALLQRQQSALQRSTLANASSLPNNVAQVPTSVNGTGGEQARNINQLKQATLATAAPVAGAGAQGLSATQGILHMQALQSELIRQQQAQLQAKQQHQLKALPQAANANAAAPGNVPGNAAPSNAPKGVAAPAVRPQAPPVNARPASEVVIWKGKISTQPSRFQQDAKARDAAPSVAALISTKNGKADDYLPSQWPSGYLTITGARKLDVLELQNMARKGICRFVEFRPFVEEGGDVTKNAFMVQQFANKLANSALMFIYHFGPLPGCGVVLVPHRGQPNAPYRLLGACFFTSAIPATLGPLPVVKPGEQPQKPMPAQPTPPQAPAPSMMMNPMANHHMRPPALQAPAPIRPPMPMQQQPIPMNNPPPQQAMPNPNMDSGLNDLTPEQIQMLMNQLQQMQGGSLMT